MRYQIVLVFISVGNGFEYQIEYLNFTDILKCRIPKSNFSKISNIKMKLFEKN